MTEHIAGKVQVHELLAREDAVAHARPLLHKIEHGLHIIAVKSASVDPKSLSELSVRSMRLVFIAFLGRWHCCRWRGAARHRLGTRFGAKRCRSCCGPTEKGTWSRNPASSPAGVDTELKAKTEGAPRHRTCGGPTDRDWKLCTL